MQHDRDDWRCLVAGSLEAASRRFFLQRTGAVKLARPAAMSVSVHSPEDLFRRALHASHDVRSGNARPRRIIPFPPLLAKFSSCPAMTLHASKSK